LKRFAPSRKDTGALSIKICVLLRKDRSAFAGERRLRGLRHPNEFVVGYGLDYNSGFRNLPFIGVLSDESNRPPPSEYEPRQLASYSAGD
jgi:hypoxanthine phosphoribosyltransferase